MDFCFAIELSHLPLLHFSCESFLLACRHADVNGDDRRGHSAGASFWSARPLPVVVGGDVTGGGEVLRRFVGFAMRLVHGSDIEGEVMFMLSRAKFGEGVDFELLHLP